MRGPPSRRPRAALALTLLAVLAGCGPSAEPAPSEPAGPPLLRERTAEWGIDFVHSAAFTGDYPISEAMGSGVIVLDADGDGRMDLYFCNAGPRQDSPAPDRLYVALEGGGFEDATERSGLGRTTWSTGGAAADFDNDGDVDLYVGCWGPDALFLNDGSGRFTDASAGLGERPDRLTSSVAPLDFDLDGYLDIFVCHYVVPDPERYCGAATGEREYCNPTLHVPVPDALYRNRGDGTFEDVSLSSGVGSEAATGLGVAVCDFDDDGWPDVYVANDLRPNQLWINQHDGTFREQAMQAGVALNEMGIAEASMGVDITDVDGDGHLDVFLTHLRGQTNTLYRGGKGRSFDDVSTSSGVGDASRPLTGFGTAFADIDHDGLQDLVIANGRVTIGDALPGAAAPPPWDRYAEPNQILLGAANGRFDDVTARAGDLRERVELSRGLAIADLDGDGDVDVVITNIGGPARVYENVAEKRGTWLAVRVGDAALRRTALGARVEVVAGGKRHVRLVGAGWSYMSASTPVAHFGLGDGAAVESVVVVWPGGDRETFAVDGVDRVVDLVRGAGAR